MDDNGHRRPPAWWFVLAVLSLLLIVAGFVASLADAGVGLVALGFPGAFGMLGLGLWSRRNLGG